MYRVLVVDNTPDFRSTLSGLLTDAGHIVRSAASDGEAWTAFMQDSFDFALIDVRLHEEAEEDESGLSLAMAFRALKPEMHVILLTGYVRTRQIVRAIRYFGVADFVEKTGDWQTRIFRVIQEVQEAHRKASIYQVQRAEPDQYSISTIRNLIRGAFTAKELLRFCQDRPVFRPILTRFGVDFGLEDMIDVLLEYCQTRMLFFELLSEIRDWNPRQYERYHDQLYGSEVLSRGAVEPQPLSADILRGQLRLGRMGDTTRLSLSLAANRAPVVRARGRHVCSVYTPKLLQLEIERYSRKTELARHDRANLRFHIGDIGRDLWREIFADHPEIMRVYLEARAKSQVLSLLFEASRDFLSLPFEFTRSDSPPEYLVLQHPLARFLCDVTPRREAISPQMLAFAEKLRVLIIASNTQPSIDGVDAEARALHRYLKRQDCIPVEVELIPAERATYEYVRAELRKQAYDVIHYAGHGRYETESPEESSLYFWTEENMEGDVVPMKATELKMLLERSEARLVYLSSCYGTTTGSLTALLDDDFLGLADAVALAGIPTVLGFRWPVSDDGACRLALEFYQSLLEQGSPEVALWSARCELAALDRNDPTWLSPILIHQE